MKDDWDRGCHCERMDSPSPNMWAESKELLQEVESSGEWTSNNDRI